MATEMIEQRRGAFDQKISQVEWTRLQRTFECRVLLCPEKGGGFSAHALRLPGVVSQGETVDDALCNIADAFQGAVQTYLENGGAIPWKDARIARKNGCVEGWILVNV